MNRLREQQPSGRLKAVRVDLHWIDGARSVATLTVDDHPPTVLMVDGEPFVRADVCGVLIQAGTDPRYFQVKPYRVDAGLLEDC